MASPFHFFRKHQKAFLAIAAVLAMVVFVFADLLLSAVKQPGGGRSANEEVVTWNGGSITVQELDYLRQRRYFISRFLQMLQGTAAQRIMQEGGTPAAPNVPDFILARNLGTRQVEVGCVTTRVLAELAQKAGISISDEVINHYLAEVGLRRMGDGDIAGVLQAVSRAEARAAEQRLFSGLRELLLGNTYFTSFGSSFRNIMPEERWQDWLRVNQRIAVEATIVPTAAFVSKVSDPSNAELVAFYDQYKDAVGGGEHMVLRTRLPSPNPGFREPQRVKLQYLMGDVSAWTDKYLDEVTDEEIADYYERNKRLEFVKAAETSATEDEADAEDEDEPAEDDTGQHLAPSPFQLTAFQDDEETEVSAGGNARSDPETAAESSEPEASEPEANTTEKPTDDEPDDEADEDTDDEKPVEYEPLENVSDLIRRKLATDKAVIELQRVVERTYAELQSEYNPYGFEVVSAKSEKREPPAPPAKLADLSDAARDSRLFRETTALLDYRELAETDVGMAVDTQTGRIDVAAKAFTDLPRYEPFLGRTIDGTWYLVLKVEDQPSRVPELHQIKDQVVDAWKEREAAKLALAEAKQLAEQAQAAGETLVGFMTGKGYEVVTTDLFSWLTFGTTALEAQRGARLGDAPPLEAVGPEFMKEAFELKPDQVAAVMSYDQNNAYAIRLDQRERTQEELRETYLKEGLRWYASPYGQSMTMGRWQRAQRALSNQILDRVGLNMDKLEAEYRRDDEN